MGIDIWNQPGMFPGIREGEHAPAAADGAHLGHVPVDQYGGAPVECVQVGTLKEFRGKFPGIEGDAFHSSKHEAEPASGGGVMSCRGGMRSVQGEKSQEMRILGVVFAGFYLMKTEAVIHLRI